MNPKIQDALKILTSGIAQCIPQEELIKKLESEKKLQIKLGMDPTAPDLHLGHAVVLKKMKQFQDLGHEVIFLIGDYTARIGDPTGKSKTRPPLTDQQILDNAKTYFAQVGKILDLQKLTIVYNSSWLGKLTFADVIKMCSKITVARLIERDDFAKRLASNTPIAMHELLYPIMQSYDSVHLKSDVELGGTDQTFNLLCGRFLQEQYGQPGQVVLTVPLLEGLDGVEKMSKSLGNAIGLFDQPGDAYGKLMSIPDHLVYRYFLLLLDRTDTQIQDLKQQVSTGKIHPMDLKKQMAHEVVATFWSKQEADQAQNQFQALFQNKDLSLANEVKLSAEFCNQPVWIVKLLQELKAVQSSSDVKRLIDSGAVSIDDMVIKDFKAEIKPKRGMIIKVGKHRIYKVA
ncbi:tyrosine--tRNA ligase [candidate division TM6 bacterium RIFCSPHIGHO2_12_FULL_38_8]|nr:MAG: tyrosine--tRNA ligase [candidate division TM6 bacterium RIFCSPHIGHO2_12_FULL_38_8]